MIKTVTRGSRTILNTTVLDVFPSKPKVRSYPSDEECYDDMEQIVMEKSTETILGCGRRIDPKHRLYRLNAKSLRARSTPQSADIQRKTTWFVPCFHSGFCFNHVTWPAKLRPMFAYHSILTFSSTVSQSSPPEWSQETFSSCQVWMPYRIFDTQAD